MTIGKKLTISFGAMSLLVLVLAFSSLFAIGRIGGQLDKAVTITAAKMDLIQSVGRQLNGMQSAARGAQISIINSDNQTLARSTQTFDSGRKLVVAQIEQLRPLLETESGKAAIQQIEAGITAWLPLHEQYLDRARKKQYSEAHKIMTAQIDPILESMQQGVDTLIQQQKGLLSTAGTDAASTISWSRWTALILIAVSLVIAAAVVMVIRSVNTSLREATAEMSEGVEQVASASSQVSAASQSLAQASSEQAASLEETSASAEEITSMTRKNAENAQAAAKFTKEVDERVSEANKSLNEMITSMKEINSASDKISRIIKVIDEIAFQTNILALNAAVEAARAGEAGLGFAVVADEVRNLAQRSAQAAKDTAAMIEESISKSNEGSAKLDHVAGAMSAITDSATKVKTLADEVSLGSQEQARGMDQIAQAIAQMDQLTQKTAANAEESASAGEELNAQANSMRTVAQQLGLLVDGEKGAGKPVSVRKQRLREPGRPSNRSAAGTTNAERDSKGLKALRSAIAGEGRKADGLGRPELVAQSKNNETFPLDDDFKEF